MIMFVPSYCNVAVTAGVAVRDPLVMAMKFVIATVPPAGIVNGRANGGVWAKEVTLVPPVPPTMEAGLMETPRLAHWPDPAEVVQEFVTLLAPGVMLPPQAGSVAVMFQSRI